MAAKFFISTNAQQLGVGAAGNVSAYFCDYFSADCALKTVKKAGSRALDALIKQLKGIVCLGVEIITRVHSWTISMTTKPKPLTWSSVNNCTTLITESDTISNLVTINLIPEDNRSAGKGG